MKAHLPIASAVLLSSLLVPLAAYAQDPVPPLPAPAATSPAAPTTTAASDAPPALPAPPAPPPPPAVVVAPAAVSCRLGGHAGIEEADATTAGRLVCDEIARLGPAPGAHYRVDIGKLGSTVILSVAHEGGNTNLDTRELRLQSIEEVSVAAPRLASAIVHGEPIAETETTQNLVGEETRVPKTKAGSIHFALGLEGLMPPLSQGAAPAAGVIMDWHYEANRFELGAGLRAGGGSGGGNNDPSMGYFMVDLGGRYYFTETDFSPYVGGGLEWMYLNLSAPGEDFNGNNGGLGAFANAGVEVLRTHHAHLAIGARLDLPFFSIQNQNANSGASAFNGPVATPSSSTYWAPLSLEMRLTF